jgi:peroxiredoxin
MKRRALRTFAALFITAAAALALAVPALAVTTNPGDRAPELAGWDIVGQRRASLDDYRGQWVLVEFWAAWCRPCMKDLPDFLAAVAPYRERGKLAVVTVSLDDPDTLPDLRRVIRANRLDYPVLYDGGHYQSVPYVEWGVYGAPSTYLVDPQGVIAAAGLRGQPLDRVLAYFLDAPHPALGLRSHCRANPDGSISVFAEVTNPAHTPLSLTVDTHWQRCTCVRGDASRTVTAIDSQYAKGLATPILEFDAFGEASYEYRFTPASDVNVVGYVVHLDLPDSAGADGGPLSFTSQTSQAYFRGLCRSSDGKLHLAARPEDGPWLTKAAFEAAAPAP